MRGRGIGEREIGRESLKFLLADRNISQCPLQLHCSTIREAVTLWANFSQTGIFSRIFSLVKNNQFICPDSWHCTVYIHKKNIAAAQSIWYQHRYFRNSWLPICKYLDYQISRVPKFPNIFLREVLALVEGLVSGLFGRALGPDPYTGLQRDWLPIHRRLPGSIASWVAHFMQPARKSQLDSVSAVQRKNRRHFVPTEEQSLKRIADKSRKFALFLSSNRFCCSPA
jgi:hypothetical protein